MIMKNLIAIISVLMCAAWANAAGLQEVVDYIVSDSGADVGVIVVQEGKAVCAVNADKLYPSASVAKLPQAMAVVDTLHRAYHPVTMKIAPRPSAVTSNTYGQMHDGYRHPMEVSVADLLRQSLRYSDNRAAAAVVDFAGGEAMVQRYVDGLGIKGCHVSGVGNHAVNNEITPRAAAMLLERLYGEAGFEWVVRTFETCRTGFDRLPKPLAGKNCRLGHKTGTGVADANGVPVVINDVGMVSLPDGRRYSIVVFVKGCKSVEKAEATIAKISEVTYNYFAGE